MTPRGGARYTKPPKRARTAQQSGADASRGHRQPGRGGRARSLLHGRAPQRYCEAAAGGAVPPVATAFAYVGRMYVIGRGIESATAREIALKLTETCRVAAEPLTATDLAHGRDRRARCALPRLDDRFARREPSRPRGRSRTCARGGRDGGGERECRLRDRGRGVHAARARAADTSSSPVPLPMRRDSTPTIRSASPRSHARALSNQPVSAGALAIRGWS